MQSGHEIDTKGATKLSNAIGRQRCNGSYEVAGVPLFVVVSVYYVCTFADGLEVPTRFCKSNVYRQIPLLLANNFV